jgi:DNA-directed RNA polymerase II subunit RPB2
MTIGQMFEGIFGKHTCLTGENHYATTFDPHHVDETCEKLHQMGYQRHGKERLYNGMTGKSLDTLIYIGPTYYQRLKHLVSSKIHSRGSQGPIVNSTRQPMEGKAKDGGSNEKGPSIRILHFILFLC